VWSIVPLILAADGRPCSSSRKGAATILDALSRRSRREGDARRFKACVERNRRRPGGSASRNVHGNA
jgi:hypothetical protein